MAEVGYVMIPVDTYEAALARLEKIEGVADILNLLKQAARPLASEQGRTWLDKADALRQAIADRVGGNLPDSTELLTQMRKERDDAILSVC